MKDLRSDGRISGGWILLALAAVMSGCSSNATPGASDGQNVTEGTAAKDVADQRCEVVLRFASTSEVFGGEVFFDPKTKISWVRYRAVVDVDSALLKSGATVGLLYQSLVNISAPNAVITVNAINAHDNPGDPALTNPSAGLEQLHGGQTVPAGYTRLSFATTTDTFHAGDDHQPGLHMIPFVHLPDGRTLWDHNRNASTDYTLDAQHDFAVRDDFAACPKPSAK